MKDHQIRSLNILKKKKNQKKSRKRKTLKRIDLSKQKKQSFRESKTKCPAQI
jgi:hypothetical protein